MTWLRKDFFPLMLLAIPLILTGLLHRRPLVENGIKCWHQCFATLLAI